MIAHYDLSTWLFDTMVAEKVGKIVNLDKIKGYEPGVKAWCSPWVRVPKEIVTQDSKER